MHNILLLAVAAIGVDVGWQPTEDGHLEYIIQIEPHQLKTLAAGDTIDVGVRPELRDVCRYRIVIGNQDLPRTALPPKLSPAPEDDSLLLPRGKTDSNVAKASGSTDMRNRDKSNTSRAGDGLTVAKPPTETDAAPSAKAPETHGILVPRALSDSPRALTESPPARRPAGDDWPRSDKSALQPLDPVRNFPTKKIEDPPLKRPLANDDLRPLDSLTPSRTAPTPLESGAPEETVARGLTKVPTEAPSAGVGTRRTDIGYPDRSLGPSETAQGNSPEQPGATRPGLTDSPAPWAARGPADTMSANTDAVQPPERGVNDGLPRSQALPKTNVDVVGPRYPLPDSELPREPARVAQDPQVDTPRWPPLTSPVAPAESMDEIRRKMAIARQSQASVTSQPSEQRPSQFAARPAAAAFGAAPAMESPGTSNGNEFVAAVPPAASPSQPEAAKAEGTPGDNEAETATGTIPSSRPWLPLTLSLLALFASLGGNLYLGWMTLDIRRRFRHFAYSLRHHEEDPARDDLARREATFSS